MGGRRKKLLKHVDEILDKKGVHPIDEVLKLMPDLSKKDQAFLWMEILAYTHAKPKAEMAEEENPFAGLSLEELIKLAKEQVPELKAG
jgi:hypothetical protein